MITNLLLPKRYESLQDAAVEKEADLTQIVRKVPDATARIEQLLRQVSNGGLGRFELFVGPSGSGKTTFLSTLPRFYAGAHVTPISDKFSLAEAAAEIRSLGSSPVSGQVFVMLERDNPNLVESELRSFFEELRRTFRTREGRVLVIWPITDETSAELIQSTAWAVGSDSIVDFASRGRYEFTGLPKSAYFEVADITARSLNSGQGLEAFGLGVEVVQPMLQRSATISQFYSLLEAKSQELNNQFGDTLKERRLPSVWILVGGDDTRELSLTVANLTQGTEKRIDIDRMIAVLDAGDSTTGYLGEWRKKRHQVAFLLRHLDVRLFELTPNVAVSAIRAFGDAAITDKLNKKKESAANASSAIQVARFFQLLTGAQSSNAATIRAASVETADEYKRVQQLASKSDKAMNKALAACIARGLEDVGIGGVVTAEQRKLDPKSNLQPDIMIDLADGRLVCIEPTWRTTGVGIVGEIPEQQSSMTVGHIQQYLLSKVLEYVNDLGA
ncbi:ATP-binding protein [Pseudomonas sp. BO3-4]|uniref:ATP-binding protein n=1 Tax=Pseudomonas sp. BO3-4 TaxID=3094916 RepID=UPI002A5A52E1|nr:ATP-binding protein [Pseudomonas sp. BO3-4]WPO31645.1 ATP-binding protein [Pseudomonas sp. BO3-4]